MSPLHVPAVCTIYVSEGIAISLLFWIVIPSCVDIKQILVSASIRVVNFSSRKKGMSCVCMRTPVCAVWVSDMSSCTLHVEGWKGKGL